MNPGKVALRHARDEQGWEGAEVVDVRATPEGTFVVSVRVRDPVTGAEIEYGVRVGRRGSVLEDGVRLPRRTREGGS